MAFNINFQVPVLFGEGVAKETGKKLKEKNVKKVLCVYDKGVKDAGLVDNILSYIKAEGIAVAEFSGVVADPPVKVIDDAAVSVKKENVDAVLGIGGGSSIDTAKAINVLLNNPGSIKDYLVMGKSHNPGKLLYAIPTTSGTGSEVTAVSVVTNTDVGLKLGVVGPATTVTLAIVDPELLLGLPAGLTASTGMDAFSHAAESYTCAMNNPMSDVLGLGAISIIARYLPIAVKDGRNIQARSQMCFASTIAGMAFNDAPPHLGHAIAHMMGSKYHIPHGVGCGLSVPTVLEYLSDVIPDRIRAIGKAMGLQYKDGISNEELGIVTADAVRKLNREIGLPSWKSLGFGEEGLKEIAKDAPRDGCWFAIPKQTGSAETLKLIQKEYSVF